MLLKQKIIRTNKRKIMKQKYFLSSLLVSFFLTFNFYAADIYVSSAGNDSTGDGTSGTPFLTIGKAVIEANADDTIIIVGTVTQDGEVNIDKNLTFTSESNGVINGNGTNRLFNISATDLAISFIDIIFQNISSSEQGAVINSSLLNTGLTITNCVFSSNSSTSIAGGGALYLSGGGTTTVTISNSTFYNNQILTATTSEARGGAIIVYNATVNITNCTFFENKLARAGNFHGAAIRASANGATVTATNCLFYNNKSEGGTGVYSDFNAVPGATMTMINCLAQFQNNIDTNTGSTITNTDYLSGSSLAWNAAVNSVTYTAADALSDDTPIDYGTDNNDVGAWDSEINIFEGATSILWSEPTNWSSGIAPIGDGTENIAILTGKDCNMYSDGIAVNNIKVTSELRIQNEKVFIVNGESDVTGIVRYFRNLSDDADLTKAWYLVSSPLSGEIFDTAFADKNDITDGSGTNRAIATYNPGETGAAAWTYFTGTNISATPGKGFSMKITPDAITFAASGGEYVDNAVGFEGDFNTNNAGVTISTATTGYNLLGNPYPAHINSATFLGAATSENIDQSQIWVWNQATEVYEVKNSGSGFILAPTQGFFVNVTEAGSVNFAESNQATTGGTFQKSSLTELKLLMTDGQNNRFAKIYYSDIASKGYDFGWEGETFGGVPNSLDVFTHLVENNQGKNYQVQSLPLSELESIIVPVGVRATSGKEITFSIEQSNVPAGLKFFLEDRELNTFTELNAAETLKVTPNNALDGIGRFYLHASKSALSVVDNDFENVSIYKTNNTTLRFTGLSQGKATVKLFNVLGKQVLQNTFVSNGVQDLQLPKIATGIYIVQIETEKGKLNKKIILE
jgi:hypothetical protein